MLQVINTLRTFNQVHVGGPKPRVINLEAMGRPGSSAPVDAAEEPFLSGNSFRVVVVRDEAPAVVAAPAPAPKAEKPPKTADKSEGK